MKIQHTHQMKYSTKLRLAKGIGGIVASIFAEKLIEVIFRKLSEGKN